MIHFELGGFLVSPQSKGLASLLPLDVLSTLLQCFILTFSIVQIVNSKQIEDVTRMQSSQNVFKFDHMVANPLNYSPFVEAT